MPTSPTPTEPSSIWRRRRNNATGPMQKNHQSGRLTLDIPASQMNLAQKKEMLGKHVLYEFSIFTAGIANFKTKELTDIERQLWFESNVLHARCLNEFFGADKRNRREDTVLACDFVKNPDQWNTLGPKDWQLEIHKRSAHLTTRRLDEKTDPELWEKLAGQILGDIIRQMDRFISDISPDLNEEAQKIAEMQENLKCIVSGSVTVTTNVKFDNPN